MFEDSLVESQGRIRTQSKWFAIGSFFAQSGLLLLLMLYPLLHPEALPRQSIERLLLAPPPPRSSAPVQVRHATAPAAAHSLASLQAQLQAPTTIPTHISNSSGEAPPDLLAGIPGGDSAGIPGGIPLGPAAPTVTVVRPPAPTHPVAISSGVAAGLLLDPIRPIYPANCKSSQNPGHGRDRGHRLASGNH